MDFLIYYKNVVDDELTKLFEKIKLNIPQPVFDAMEYSVMANGKRLRPILCIMSAEAVTDDIKISIGKAMPFAIATELIHNYSLIHDDMPCMDNDDYRRGRLTTHKKFGEGVALLAGDALLNLAFEVLMDNLEKNSTIENIKATNLICKSAGVCSGMIKGQVYDVYNKNATLEDLDKTNFYKTGALINCAVCSGAICVGASCLQIDKLGVYADSIGKAFQIADDILDIESTTEILGKSVGSDEKNNKITYPFLVGLDKSKAKLKEYETIAISALKEANIKSDNLENLAIFLTNRKK